MKLSRVRQLTPFGVLCYFITERENIRLARYSGDVRNPWTDDRILQGFRFTNVRRMDDKVSRWLLENWYEPYFNHPNMLYACSLARFFNKPETLDPITPWVFCICDPNWRQIASMVRRRRDAGEAVFNGAYVVRGNDGIDKISSVVDYYTKPLKDVQINPDSMQDTHAAINASYGMGSFMAGQITADLRWAVKGTWADRNDWAPIGPGSKRGMNRLHGLDVNAPLSQADFLDKLRALVIKLRAALPESITERLEAIDYQSCLCELDKYMRTLSGEGKPKQRYAGY